MSGDALGKLATGALGTLVVLLALDLYLQAAAIASPVAVLLALVLAILGLIALARAAEDRFS